MKEFIEKLISRLEEYKKQWIDADYLDGIDEIIEIVNELAEEYKLLENIEQLNNGWIPCSQRLPNCEKDFLVTLRDGDVKVARYEKEENIWVDIIEGYFEYPVAAWCELPEPYKKGSETDE